MRIRNIVTVLAFAAMLTAGTGGIVAADAAPGGCGWTLVPTPPVPGADTLSAAPQAGASIVTPAYGSIVGVDAVASDDVRFAGQVAWPNVGAGWLLQGNGRSVATAPDQLPQIPFIQFPAFLPPGASSPSFDSADDGWVITGRLGTTSNLEHWHDGRWTAVQVETLTGERAWPWRVAGVSNLVALSPTNAWAIGEIQQGLALVGTEIQHWDGTSWQLVPQPLADEPGVSFNALTAVTPDDVWLVGQQHTDAGSVPIAEHWDGAHWTLVDPPGGNKSSALFGVSATGPDDIWAVGDQVMAGSDTLAAPMVEHFDGSTWQVVNLPDIGNSLLSGVYAAAPDDVWAIGQFAFGLNQVFLHWDGKSWSPVAVPGTKKYNAAYIYNAIDGSGPGDVWAVGRVDDYGNQTTYPVAAHLACGS